CRYTEGQLGVRGSGDCLGLAGLPYGAPVGRQSAASGQPPHVSYSYSKQGPPPSSYGKTVRRLLALRQ
ncbi:MAG: hypothetical protein ABI586_06515, partial [Candidatus Nanopelagicales bacterium]